jgi:hypothetical protein
VICDKAGDVEQPGGGEDGVVGGVESEVNDVDHVTLESTCAAAVAVAATVAAAVATAAAAASSVRSLAR